MENMIFITHNNQTIQIQSGDLVRDSLGKPIEVTYAEAEEIVASVNEKGFNFRIPSKDDAWKFVSGVNYWLTNWDCPWGIDLRERKWCVGFKDFPGGKYITRDINDEEALMLV